MDKREQIYRGINKWIDYKVDELIGGNIWMALMAATTKRVVAEFLEAILPIDILELIFSNHGAIDADVFADEIIASLENVPDISQEYKCVVIHLSKGVIKVELPSTNTVKAILNGDNVINFREPDIRELAQYINEAKGE